MIKLLPRHALFASIIAMGLSTAVLATQPAATGLGQSWPNVTDVSASTHWHVYTFMRDGIEYIQVNDLNGNVRGAVAASNGTFLVLPMGMDAGKFSTAQSSRNISAVDCHDPVECNTHRQDAGTLVYQDNSVMVYAIAQSDGSVHLNAVAVDCHDPVECNTHRQDPTTQSWPLNGRGPGNTAAVDCHDPVECNTHRQNPTTDALLLNGRGLGGTAAVDCHDPVECNTHRQVINGIDTAPAPQAMGTHSGSVAVDCHDPVECNTH